MIFDTVQKSVFAPHFQRLLQKINKLYPVKDYS